MKLKLPALIITVIIALVLFLTWAVKEKDRKNNLKTPDTHLIMRSIGHQFLMAVGDNSSRVMEIKHKDDHSYEIPFENSFAFEPDTLVSVVLKAMGSQTGATGYSVKVLKCQSEDVVYGFEIHEDAKQNIIPCLGRALPLDCYYLRIRFHDKPIQKISYVLISLLLVLSLWTAYKLIRRKTSNDLSAEQEHSNYIQLSDIQFFYEQRHLVMKTRKISLSTKENEILYLLASKPNEVLGREYLQKEIWEDNGVIVGRSLDVFISKLRKKLAIDPKISIINSHGKGYKLEIHPFDTFKESNT